MGAAREGNNQTMAAAERNRHATIKWILANDGSVLRNQDLSTYASQIGKKKAENGDTFMG